MKKIKNFYWSINEDVLEIYIIDTNNNEYILATIKGCKNISNKKADRLTAEIIEEHELTKE